MNGVWVNGIGIVVGTALGWILRQWISPSLHKICMTAIGFGVLAIGIKDAVTMQNPLVVLMAVVIGGIVGHALRIEEGLNRFGDRLERKYAPKDAGSGFGQGFTMATILFCVGAMSILASIKAGVAGDHSLLYVKAFLDGVTAMLFTATMGLGVGLSVVPVVIYQGLIFLFAGQIQSILSPWIIQELSAVGGVLVMMISFNIMEIKKTPIADFLPAILLPVIYGLIAGL